MANIKCQISEFVATATFFWVILWQNSLIVEGRFLLTRDQERSSEREAVCVCVCVCVCV